VRAQSTFVTTFWFYLKPMPRVRAASSETHFERIAMTRLLRIALMMLPLFVTPLMAAAATHACCCCEDHACCDDACADDCCCK
jgi:hypothetical protein